MARWGFFTAFRGTSIKQTGVIDKSIYLEATFPQRNPIRVYPYEDPVCTGINLVGRSTSAAGAREVTPGASEPESAEEIRRDNNLIAKFYWPQQTRVSEVDVIKKAAQIGETNNLVKDRIPTIVGNIDPPHVTCSTSLIREFLGLDTAGARVLRVIIFRRLKELKYLDEEDMLIAFLDCFFCRLVLRFLVYSQHSSSGRPLGTVAKGSPAQRHQHRKPDVRSGHEAGSSQRLRPGSISRGERGGRRKGEHWNYAFHGSGSTQRSGVQGHGSTALPTRR